MEDVAVLALKPSTLLNFHRALVRRKYQLLFSPKRNTKPGPKGPDADLIRAVVEMKQRNPTWGCPRIAEQINLAFGTSIDKDVVRRILALHYQPAPNGGGPSWLTFLGHTKDSLWSVDLMRCESVALRTYWVLVVMDQYTRRIIGFGIQAGVVDGLALCRMFKQAIRGATKLPKYLSSDHDPLYRFHQWEANLRVLSVEHGCLRSALAPIRGTFDRHNQTRVFGPSIILDGSRSGTETICLQKLLQRIPKPCVVGRKDADRNPEIERRRFQIVSLAETLSWVIPNTNRCVNTNSPWTRSRQNFLPVGPQILFG